MNFSKAKVRKGEIVLIILLIMAVGLTVGLSVTSRSITDLKQTNQMEESNRAFSAAEAGIEKALEVGVYDVNSIPQTSVGEAKYTVDVAPFGNTTSLYAIEKAVEDGDAETIWLVPHNTDGSLNTEDRYYNANSINICWRSTSGDPALEVSAFFYDIARDEYKIARVAYDVNNVSHANNFTHVDRDAANSKCAVSGKSGYTYIALVGFTTMGIDVSSHIPIALRVRPIYSDAEIAVQSVNNASIPEQGKNILSTGQFDKVTRKWNVTHSFPASRDIFDYAVWSGTDLVKNN